MILQLSHWGWAILIAVTELLQVSASCWSWLGSFLSVGPQFGPLGWFFFVLWCFLSSLDPNRTKQGFLRLRLRTGTKLNNHYILLVIAGQEARLEWWKKGTGALRLLGYMEGWRGVIVFAIYACVISAVTRSIWGCFAELSIGEGPANEGDIFQKVCEHLVTYMNSGSHLLQKNLLKQEVVQRFLRLLSSLQGKVSDNLQLCSKMLYAP